MSLKELTMKQHHNAERQKFAGVLMSGKISEDTYIKYLMNQHHCYSALENLKEFKLPDKRLKRSKKIQKDAKKAGFDLIFTKKMLLKSIREVVIHVSNE